MYFYNNIQFPLLLCGFKHNQVLPLGLLNVEKYCWSTSTYCWRSVSSKRAPHLLDLAVLHVLGASQHFRMKEEWDDPSKMEVSILYKAILQVPS